MNTENKWYHSQDLTQRHDHSIGYQSDKKKQDKSRTVISVREMGDLLGLKKTERYWLVHKNVFETKKVLGKMWVDITSFENWYANQLKYKKVTGEEPGKNIREWTYSVKDISEMLAIVEASAYDLIKRESIETVVIDDRIRVPKTSFHKWYSGQSHYRTQEDRKTDAKIKDSTLSFPQMASLLGVPRNTVYNILRDKRYRSFFEIIVVADKRRVTKESFAAFLKGQDQYRLRTAFDDRYPSDSFSEEGYRINAPGEYYALENATGSGENCSEDRQCEYISLEEAASKATMSRQAISRYAEKGCFKYCRIGRTVRICRSCFEKWLASRQGG